jgi:hypothetical protein
MSDSGANHLRSTILPATASLGGIPTELRLQIFRYLLPKQLPITLAPKRPSAQYTSRYFLLSRPAVVQPDKGIREACSIFRNLILTSRRINTEATELLFANIDIEFALDHNDRKHYGKSVPGLYGFDYL